MSAIINYIWYINLIKTYYIIVYKLNQAGFTPLHWSALKGHIDCVKWLVSKGANIEASDEVSDNVIYAVYKSYHILSYLMISFYIN